MTRQVRRAVLAFTVFAASGAAHREAHADGLGEKLCSLHCGLGTIQCHQDGGSMSFCGGFALGCAAGCKLSII